MAEILIIPDALRPKPGDAGPGELANLISRATRGTTEGKAALVWRSSSWDWPEPRASS